MKLKITFKGKKIMISENYFESNSRIKSWEICHKQFESYLDGTTDDDLMALHLFAYLSNWGMLRNSKLINYNYTIFKNLLTTFKDNSAYTGLLNSSPNETNFNDITELYNHIKDYLNKIGISATYTLVTKIILGTYACLPAFDTNVKKATGFKPTRNTAEDIIKTTIHSYSNNRRDINKAKNCINKTNKKSGTQISEYTDMRTLDAILWELGK